MSFEEQEFYRLSELANVNPSSLTSAEANVAISDFLGVKLSGYESDLNKSQEELGKLESKNSINNKKAHIEGLKKDIANINDFKKKLFELKNDYNLNHLEEHVKGSRQAKAILDLTINDETMSKDVVKGFSHIKDLIIKETEKEVKPVSESIKRQAVEVEKPLKKGEIFASGKMLPLVDVIVSEQLDKLKISGSDVQVNKHQEINYEMDLIYQELTNYQQLENSDTKTVQELMEIYKEIKNLDIVLSGLIEVKKVLEQNKENHKSSLSNIESLGIKIQKQQQNLQNKFDKGYAPIHQVMEEKRKKESEENFHQNKRNELSNLIYQLEKAKSEDPNNYELINGLNQRISVFLTSYEIDEPTLLKLKEEAMNRYHKDAKEQQEKVSAIKEKIAYEDSLKAGVMQQIRECAIRELEASGAFKEEHEFRNGDMYSKSMNKETMIQRKMEELIRLADMTPEERGLEDLKKHGAISSDTRLEDLTPQQINDFRISYRDERYEFMADYKRWKSREQVKPKANTIYKQYIDYLKKLEDKTQALKFPQYAQQVHNIENMSEIMVDEELKEEMRGISR